MAQTPYSLTEAAINTGDITMLRSLLERHAKHLTKEKLMTGLLVYAARRDKIDVVKLLVEFGADIHAGIGKIQKQ